MCDRWLHDPERIDALIDALCWVLIAAAMVPLLWLVWGTLRPAFGV